MIQFTPTQQRIVDLLSDGLGHSKDEIYGLLLTAGHVNHIQQHISNIRRILRPVGQDILGSPHNDGTWHYRLVRYINRQ